MKKLFAYLRHFFVNKAYQQEKLDNYFSHGSNVDLQAKNLSLLPSIDIDYPLERPRKSYSYKINKRCLSMEMPTFHGWCFGLPRGISSTQWPLARVNGLPLQFHFCVRVPEDYRVQGKSYVALAFFSDSHGRSEGVQKIQSLMNSVLNGGKLPATVVKSLTPFLNYLKNRHPMEMRFRDRLKSEYAVIWLDEEEFDGPICQPPTIMEFSANSHLPLPYWLNGNLASPIQEYVDRTMSESDKIFNQLKGTGPKTRFDKFAYQICEVTDDPNVGKKPVDNISNKPNLDNYWIWQGERDEETGFDPLVTYADLHFGGTAMSIEAMPFLTPFFMEFEENNGDINLGGGNAQLDLMTLQFSWAQ